MASGRPSTSRIAHTEQLAEKEEYSHHKRSIIFAEAWESAAQTGGKKNVLEDFYLQISLNCHDIEA
jgi:hypothetical protein